jgi:hypothetical protein
VVNKLASNVTLVANVFIVLGVLAGIALGSQYGQYGEFSWGIGIITWIVTGSTGLFFILLCQIVDFLDKINRNTSTGSNLKSKV